jgi:hypothetical protein
MKLGLINSAWVQANQPTEFGLRKTKEIGFDSVDIFVDPLELDVRERRLIKRTLRRGGPGGLQRQRTILSPAARACVP